MPLLGFSSDGHDGHKASSSVAGVVFATLFLFLLFMITFLWWRNLFPHLQTFARWLSKGAQKAKNRLPWGQKQTVVLPPPDSPRTTDPILLAPPPFVGRHHGADSVDTLPRYTPKPSPPPTEYSRSTSETG